MGFFSWLAGQPNSQQTRMDQEEYRERYCGNCLHYFEYMGDRGCSNFFASSSYKYKASKTPMQHTDCPKFSKK